MAKRARTLRLPIAILALILAAITCVDAPSAFLGASLTVVWWLALAVVSMGGLFLLLRPIDVLSPAALGLSLIMLIPGNGVSSSAEPLPRDRESTSIELSILTYNVLFRGGLPSTTIATINSAGADVLIFQEVTPSWEQRLRKLKGFPYRHFRSHVGTHGLAILSRYPLANITYLKNSRGLAIAQCADIMTPRTPAAICNIHIASPAITFYDLRHFNRGWEENAKLRTAQWRQIVAHIETRQRKVAFVAGDLNTLETEPLYNEIAADFIDVYRATNWGIGATFPNLVKLPPFPITRIDYVLAKGAFAPVAANVLPRSGSDHMALKAWIRM